MRKFLTDFEGKAYKMDKKSASRIKKLENIEKKDAKNDDDLRFLIKNASSGNAETRSLIARLLVDFSGEDAKNALLDLCGDSDELVRTNACDSLAVYPSKKVFLRLLRIFENDGSLLVKNFALLSAIDIMQNVNSDTSKMKNLFYDCIKKYDGQIKISAYKGLYILGESGRLSDILGMLNRKDYAVRCSVINTLYDIVNAENINTIARAVLKHRNAEDSEAVISTANSFLSSINIE